LRRVLDHPGRLGGGCEGERREDDEKTTHAVAR
jgi:hypothetical protein